MRLMKRKYLLALTILLALAAAPFGLGFDHGFVLPITNDASASLPGGAQTGPANPPAAGAGTLTETQTCVAIGLPILPGMDSCTNAKGEKGISNDPTKGGAIIIYLVAVLKLLSETIGLVIVVVLIVAGIQYITSTGDPALIKSAKKRIQNAILALILFMFMYAILTFLTPGGIF
jgi:hypothetical protein